MNLRIRLLPMLLLALCVVPLAAACGGDDDDAGDLTKVTVMLEWTANTNHSGILLANARGWYAEEGIELEIIEPASTGVETAVATGAADIGISAAEYVLGARAEGLPLVSIGAIIQHNTSAFISLPKDGITRPRDLAGKKYGGFGGPLEEPLIKQFVQCDGGDPSSIQYIDVGDVDYFVGMDQDRYDFVWIFEGWDGVRAREVEQRQVNTLAFSQYTSCIPDWYTPVLITSEKMAKDDRDVLKRFMKATARGYDAAIDEPRAASDTLLAFAPETDAALAKASAAWLASRYVDKGRKWGLQDESVWTGFAAFLKEKGILAKELDARAAFTNDFLP